MDTNTATATPENLFDMMNAGPIPAPASQPETTQTPAPAAPVTVQPLAPANPPLTGASAPSAYRIQDPEPELSGALEGGVLASLSVSIWTASRKLASGSRAVAADTAGDPSAFRVQKDLVNRDELRECRQIATEAAGILKEKALPFQIRGVSFIPCGLVAQVSHRLETLGLLFGRAADRFALRYETMISESRARLGDAWRADDYPSNIRDRFAWGFRLFSVSAPGALSSIDPALYERAQADFRRDIQDFRADATAILRERFAETVSHLAERLTPAADGTRKIFRDSAVGNLKEFLTDFEALNISNDQELKAQVERTRAILSGVAPDHLRGGDYLARRVAESLTQVQQATEGLLENAPKRRIRMSEEAAQ
jgi:hypothetical protein